MPPTRVVAVPDSNGPETTYTLSSTEQAFLRAVVFRQYKDTPGIPSFPEVNVYDAAGHLAARILAPAVTDATHHGWTFYAWPGPQTQWKASIPWVNNVGQAVVNPTRTAFLETAQAYRWTINPNAMDALTPLPGYTGTIANAVDDFGVVVGASALHLVSGGGDYVQLQATAWAAPGTPVAIGPAYNLPPPGGAPSSRFPFGSVASAVDNAGSFAGQVLDPWRAASLPVWNGISFPFLWIYPFVGGALLDGADPQYLATESGMRAWNVQGVNAAGHVAGNGRTPDMGVTAEPWFWNGGAYQTVLSGPTLSVGVYGMDELDTVTGYDTAGETAYFWTPGGGLTVIAAGLIPNTFGLNSYPNSVNANTAGDAVYGSWIVNGVDSSPLFHPGNGALIANPSSLPGGAGTPAPGVFVMSDIGDDGTIVGMSGGFLVALVPF